MELGERSRDQTSEKRKQEARANLQAANFADICLANCINQHR